jgi:predicted small metal-binding protein
MPRPADGGIACLRGKIINKSIASNNDLVNIMPSFKCKDIGMDCPFQATAPNEAELEKKIAEHARSAHNIQNQDKDFWIMIKKAVK